MMRLSLPFILLLLATAASSQRLYGQVVFITDDGLHLMDLDAENHTLITPLTSTACNQESYGIDIDPTLGIVCFVCGEQIYRSMYLSNSPSPEPYTFQFYQGKRRVRDVVLVQGESRGYYSLFDDPRGWRTFAFDPVAMTHNKQPVMSVASNSAAGGFLEHYDGVEWLTVSDLQAGTSVAKETKGGTGAPLEKVKDFWDKKMDSSSDRWDITSFSITPSGAGYIVATTSGRSRLLQIDLTDRFPPQIINDNLPPYKSIGFEKFNPDSTSVPGVAVLEDTGKMVYSNGSHLLLSDTDGSRRKVVFEGKNIRSVKLVPPPLPPVQPPADPPVQPPVNPPMQPPVTPPVAPPIAPPIAPTTPTTPTTTAVAAPQGTPPTATMPVNPPAAAGQPPLSPPISADPPALPATPPPTTQTGNGGAPVDPPSSEGDTPWPFGSGSKVPFIILVAGLLCLMGGVAVLFVVRGGSSDDSASDRTAPMTELSIALYAVTPRESRRDSLGLQTLSVDHDLYITTSDLKTLTPESEYSIASEEFRATIPAGRGRGVSMVEV